MNPFRFADAWPRRRLLTVAYACLAIGMVFGFVRVEWVANQNGRERSERTRQVNTLACALRSDAIELMAAVKSRQDHALPGDAEIIRSKQAVIRAVDYLTPFCPGPKGSP